MWGVLQMNSTKLPKIILFDLDGVILDTESIYLELMVEYNKNVNMPITRKFYINNFLGRTKKDINSYYEKKHKEMFDSKQYWDGLTKYRDDYFKHNRVKIKEGFFNLKQYLKDKKYLIGIITSNSKKLTMKLLKTAGLKTGDFDIIITREDVFNTKPFPDLYVKAINYFKVDKENFIAIEDSNVGIQAALGANIKVINLKDIDVVKPNLKYKCFKCIKTLDEVINILEEMKD